MVNTVKMTIFAQVKEGRTLYRVKREGDAGFVFSTGSLERARTYAGSKAELVHIGAPKLYDATLNGRPVKVTIPEE